MAQKKKRRHLSKDELIYHLKGMARMERFSYGVAYRDTAILVNYILYTEFGFRQKSISDFNTRILEKYKEDVSQDAINKRLMEKAGFIVGYHYVSGKDIEKIGNKFVDSRRARMLDVDNEIQGEFEKYTRYAYDTLMDLGYAKVRLMRFRYYMDKYSKEIDTKDIEKQAKELFEKIGLVIAFPDGF